MQELKKLIKEHCGDHAPMLLRAMEAADINRWFDLKHVDKLKAMRDYITSNCKSGKVYTARFCGAVAPYEMEVKGFASGWRKLLNTDKLPSQQTYFSLDDLEKIAKVETHTKTEKMVQFGILIEARTGARISDTKELDELNVDETGTLTYLSKKTKRWASVPSSDELLYLLSERGHMRKYLSTVRYNQLIKQLAKRAGIDQTIKLARCGKSVVGPKWQFLSSHDARHGFCTNLHLAGEELLTISRMAGHSNTTMTERYIVVNRRPGAVHYDYLGVLDDIVRKYIISNDIFANNDQSV